MLWFRDARTDAPSLAALRAASARRLLFTLLTVGLSGPLGCAEFRWPPGPLTLAASVRGSISGQLQLQGDLLLKFANVNFGEVGPVVVYLTPLDAAPRAHVLPKLATIRRQGKTFVPSFLVLAPEQKLRFADDEGLHHRVFSYSESNPFDLEVPAQGYPRLIQFRNPGVVRFYCSLHEAESGVIFVSPSPYFDTVRASGEYEISSVPPGRYELRTWSEVIPNVSQNITIRPRRSASVKIDIADVAERE